MATIRPSSQNFTVRIDRRILCQAKVLAARRNISISRLLAEQIQALVAEDNAYATAQRRAAEQLDDGFHLGGKIAATRDGWHQR